MTSEGWKTVAGYLGSVLVTGLVAWFSFGGGVRADEVKAMIQDAPSVVEMKQKVNQLQRDVDDLTQKVDQNNEKTQQKLDTILQALPREGR